MKKLVAALLALGMLLLALSAYADGKSVSLTFEDDAYHLAFISADAADGVLTVKVSGFDGVMHMRNGKIVIPFWVYAVSGGETYGSTSVSCGSDGIYVYSVACGVIPDEIYIYAGDDENNSALLWQNTGEAEAAQESGAAIPAELVGSWQGTGIPESNGSDIALQITVNADGSGKYTFEQSGYVESYPFMLQSDSASFSVTIPADNYLSIVSCEGTYTYADGSLSLHIVTTFSGGGQYAYDAVCTKAQAPEFCGEWTLQTINFFTPDADNGIFSIDAGLSIAEGSTYGSGLTLNADGTITSDIDVYGLIEVIPQLPFSVPDLCLCNDTEWTYAEDSLSLAPGGTVLALAYDEAAAQLSLTFSGTVEIQSTTTDAGTTKGGPVEIEITLVLLRAETPETT